MDQDELRLLKNKILGLNSKYSTIEVLSTDKSKSKSAKKGIIQKEEFYEFKNVHWMKDFYCALILW